jgi:LuxR family maltose regulon positive regulatory protein
MTALELAQTARAHIDPEAVVFALSALSVGINQALIGEEEAEQTLQEAVALANAGALASTRTESLAMLALLQFAQGNTTRACDTVKAAQETYSVHELREMSSTSGILALAQIALACHVHREADIQQALAEHAAVSAEISQIFLWYGSLSAGVLAYASVRLGDQDAYRKYLSACGDSGLCQQWKTLAEQAHASATPLSQLTPAELRVWDLLKGRMTLSEIAGALFLSRETVKSHTGAIYRKLGVASRREAQELAEMWG